MTEEKPDILEMLIRHEFAIQQLYELFASMFKSHQKFWQKIAKDEQRHSHWLETLRSKKSLKNWFLSESRLKMQAITASIRYVEMQITRAQKGNFNLLEALSISKDLETALLEKQFSKMSPSVPEKIRTIFIKLAGETEQHLKEIATALDAEKNHVL
jgi:rubrerythrin